MNSIATSVESFFKREKIRFERRGRTGVFKVGFGGRSGCFVGYVDADEDRRTVLVRTLAPTRVPTGKRLQTAELLTRTNEALGFGNFELDFEAGIVAFRTSVVLGKSDLHLDVLEHLVYTNWFAMDLYFPAINMVVFGDISPERAFDKVRHQSRRDCDHGEAEPGELPPDTDQGIPGCSLN